MHYKRWKRHGDPEKREIAEKGSPMAFIRELVLRESNEECVKWPFGEAVRGYGTIHFEGKSRLAHRVVLSIATGASIDTDLGALHSCGNGQRGCVAPWHLYWGTQQENGADTVRHGKSTRGERHAQSKLQQGDIGFILNDRRPVAVIARKYAVSPTTIDDVKKGRTWSWLTGIARP